MAKQSARTRQSQDCVIDSETSLENGTDGTSSFPSCQDEIRIAESRPVIVSNGPRARILTHG